MYKIIIMGGGGKKKGFENIANIAFLLQTEMCHTIDFLYLFIFFRIY